MWEFGHAVETPREKLKEEIMHAAAAHTAFYSFVFPSPNFPLGFRSTESHTYFPKCHLDFSPVNLIGSSAQLLEEQVQSQSQG